MKKISLLTVAFLSLISCQEDDSNTVNNEPVNVAFETVSTGIFGNATMNALTPQNFVINSPADWDAFTGVFWEPVEGINVDYSQKTVISSVSDFRAGYGDLDAFEITSVLQQNDTIKVNIHSVHASSDGIELTMSYQPYQVITIPKTTLPFKFIYTQ